MRKPIPCLPIGPTLGAGIAALAAWAGLGGLAHGQVPEPLPDRPQASALEERLRRIEEINARLLEQLKRDREESARRYGELEERYRELQGRLVERRPAAEAGGALAPGEAKPRSSDLGRPGEVGQTYPVPELPLKARLGDGFQLASDDSEFELRLHVLDQTDYKFFSPNDMTFGKSGAYVPRVRVYFEGRLTRYWDYEVSLQRSLDGIWDLLDGTINLHLFDAFQIKFGRCLVPYSYLCSGQPQFARILAGEGSWVAPALRPWPAVAA
jgi:phosphate-selective porin OprO/OprP